MNRTDRSASGRRLQDPTMHGHCVAVLEDLKTRLGLVELGDHIVLGAFLPVLCCVTTATHVVDMWKSLEMLQINRSYVYANRAGMKLSHDRHGHCTIAALILEPSMLLAHSGLIVSKAEDSLLGRVFARQVLKLKMSVTFSGKKLATGVLDASDWRYKHGQRLSNHRQRRIRQLRSWLDRDGGCIL
ncbi:hypothetical protein FA95DRAFT_1094241 [Auriscalpium vulgare]|uniref:Uncharacterized protein n=1 Tax=Auriscalpium vulgare TaxID=40419 RepID=A0ACB8R5S1_9AGAM|nr:hypothetical protein FA95DRAFT_1094241 [Auriscalpium vulgare]